MQAITSITQTPVVTMVESWLIRIITAAGVAVFGDKVFTANTAIDIAGVATTGLMFAVNEGLHYLKTNKKVATAVAGEKAVIASDPALAAALSSLQTSLKTLESNLASGGKTNNV
jgi:hypothetical protein